MKAILIIDVEENVEFDKAIADIEFHDLEWNLSPTGIIGVNKWYQNVQLKPLPDKIDQGYPCEKYDEGYSHGWDACIDEILGEK